MIGLARSLDLPVVAESIERPTQLATVVALGATHSQGFLLAQPVGSEVEA